MTQERGAIKAQSAAVALATASICNAEGAPFLGHPQGWCLAGRRGALQPRCVPKAHGLACAYPAARPGTSACPPVWSTDPRRHFGYVLRPARSPAEHDPYARGLHHLCLRVDSVQDVAEAAALLRASGVDASEPSHHGDYADDYWATFFTDPDGIRLEITNFRQERRDRHERWDELPGA